MNYRQLDMNTYKRKSHFEYFNTLAYPYVGITVNVDITDLFAAIKEKELPFFLTFCYCVSRAANLVPEFRQRIKDGRIVEFDFCKTSHTVALEDETYCYCTLDSRMPFSEYLPYAVQAQEEAKKQKRVADEEDEVDGMIFISTLPWLTYVSFIQPTPIPADSNPRITWGRYFRQEGRVLLPVSVLCHHALVDGLHISRFYGRLNEQMGELLTAGIEGIESIQGRILHDR